MEAKAVARYVRVSPRKVRQVVDAIRGRDVETALNVLHFSPKRATRAVEKVVRSAVANMMNINTAWKGQTEHLTIVTAYVDEGVRWRRMRIKARGRGANIIRRRTSHITVIVSDEEH
jgi:large subunit ribosomal protein L22